MKTNFENSPNKGIYGKEKLYDVDVISTLREMLLNSFEKFSDRTAYLVKDNAKAPYREIKYKELENDVYALSTVLINKGLKDKKIAVIGENRYEWAVTYLSVVFGVGTIVPIDKELTSDEISQLLDRAGVSAVMFSEKVYKKNSEMFDSLDLIKFCMDVSENFEDFKSLLSQGIELRKEGHREIDEVSVYPDDVNVLLFTSGTTGTSKGVMLSHRNIASNLMNMCSMIYIGKEHRFFSLLPLHHTYECTCGFLCPLYRGASIAFCQGLKYIQKNMQEAKPRICLAVPLIIEAIYDKILKEIKKQGKEKQINAAIKMSNCLLKLGIDMRKKLFAPVREAVGGNLEIFISGAAPGNIEALRFFRNIGIYAIQGYGLTECSPIVAVNRLSKFDDLSAGIPVPETQIKIADADADGNGEILVKGDNVTVGYYGDEEATNKIIKDGWFHTGDLGRFENGFIYITGRKKDVIITSNGKNVFPDKVESYLNQSPYIKESMVYGEKDENGYEGLVSALIVPDFDEINNKFGLLGERETEKLISDEIKRINSGMPGFYAVRKFVVRKEALERTTTKKIKRYKNLPR